MNFAETIAYWYLRFNGFFPIRDFVLHTPSRDCAHGGKSRGSADVDLLAVRFPYVEEDIGGQKDDWDRENFNRCGLEFYGKVIGLIVEVKSGGLNNLDSFSNCRLEYAVKRLGIFPPEQVKPIVKELEQNSVFSSDGYIIGKLLISSEKPPSQFLKRICFINLAEAEKFLKERVGKYSYDKYADRIYFGDDLIQYLAWKSKEGNRSNNRA